MTRTIQQLFDLKGKTALVTGGTRGLGLQLAHALGEAGARIMLSSRKAEDLEEAAAELQAAGIDARWIAADCAREEDIRRLADETLQRMGDVDILVNNAGAAWGAPAEDHPVEAWDKVMNLNIRGYFILSQHIAKNSMIARKSGRIINIASIAGLGGNPSEMKTIAYNTSKGAVVNFTRALGAEWGPYNINVNAICPGFFPSKMTAATLKNLGEEKLAAHAPLRRLGDDEDLKGICLLFASDAGKHITGQWMAVDGGVSNHHRRLIKIGATMYELKPMKFGVEIPFVHHLGFELVLFEGGHSILKYAPKPEHLNSFGVTHGGAAMTLMDVSMAVAARSVQKDMGVVTIEMKTSFMQPAKAGQGQVLTGKGHLIHRTATMAFTEATLFDEEGKPCAHATGTFKYVKRLPTGTKTVNPLNPPDEGSGISTD